MEGTIAATGRQAADIRVLDNLDNEHTVTVTANGQIRHHETPAYPRDPTERTTVEDEHLRQTRRFARYTLADEGDQLAALMGEHPQLLDSLVGFLDGLSAGEIEGTFGPLMRQLESHVAEDVDPAMPLPEEAAERDVLLYVVFLAYDTGAAGATDLSKFFDAFGGALVENQFERMTGGESSTGIDFATDVGRTARERGYDLAEMLELQAVETWVAGLDDTGETELIVGDQLDEQPVAAVELPPIDPGSPGEFRRTLQHHFLCQARDSCLGMGVEPAHDHFRVLGHGLTEFTQRYRALDLYEDYHDPDATVSTWDPAGMLDG